MNTELQIHDPRTMESWIHGTAEPWIRGTTEPWIHGCTEVWIHGTTEPCIHGTMDSWNHSKKNHVSMYIVLRPKGLICNVVDHFWVIHFPQIHNC